MSGFAPVMPDRFSEVAVVPVDVPLTLPELAGWFVGRMALTGTRWVIATHGGQAAVLELDRERERERADTLRSPISGVAMLARPQDCRWVTAPDVDTAIPTLLVAAARRLAPGARCVIVTGRFGYVTFVSEPSQIPVRVLDVVQPDPPRLIDLTARLLSVTGRLPSVEVRPDLIDLAELAAQHLADRYLMQCRAGGVDVPGADVEFLDERPPQSEWTLVGCARSRAIYRELYGGDVESVDTCPLNVRDRDPRGGPTLTRCCTVPRGVRLQDGGRTAVVPWGATASEVADALRALVAPDQVNR